MRDYYHYKKFNVVEVAQARKAEQDMNDDGESL